MAYGTPSDPVGGTVITVAYAVANLLNPIRALRAFTGGTDPPGSNYVVTSDSVSATTWKQLVDTSLLSTWKVNAATPNVSTFASLVAANKSGFYEVVTAADGPVAGQSYYCYNVVEFNVPGSNACQIAVHITNQNETYIRLVAGGVAGTWRKLWHAGNSDFVEIAGDVMSGNLSVFGQLTVAADPINSPAGGVLRIPEVAASGGTWLVETINNTLVLARSGAASFLTLSATGAISTISATLSGALSAASGAFSGAVTIGTTLGVTGALSAASAAIAGAITGASATVTGLVKGSQLESTVAAGTAPLVVASDTMVSNLNAEFLGGFDFTALESRYAKAKFGSYAGNGSSQTITTGWAPKLVIIFGNSTMAFVLVSGTVFQTTTGLDPVVTSGITFTATAFVPAAAMNLNATGYTYAVFG